jgi:hypothetical protein
MSIKVDNLLKRSISFERLALYIDQRSFLQAIAQVQQFPPESNLGINAPFVDETTPSVQNETTQSGGTNNYEESNQSNILQMPEQTIVGYTPIPRDIQSMLNHIMMSEGGKPITIDGELGPETRKALNAFKVSFNVPSNFLDNEVYDVIRNIYDRSTKK